MQGTQQIKNSSLNVKNRSWSSLAKTVRERSVPQTSDSNISNKDTFGTLQIRKSKWTLPEGQFASLDFLIKKCRHDINKLKFNSNTKAIFLRKSVRH